MLPLNTENVKPIDDLGFLSADQFHTGQPGVTETRPSYLTLPPVSHNLTVHALQMTPSLYT